MASVDSLSILITASTGSAITKVTALTKSLKELSTTIDGLDVSKFESLAAAVGELGNNLSGIKGNAGKDIQKISDAVKTASEEKAPFDGVKKSVEDVAQKSKEAVTGVEKIEETLNAVDPVSIDGMSESLEKASSVMDQTATKMGSLKKDLVGLRIIIPTDDLIKVDKQIAKTTEKLEELRDKLNYKSAHVEGYVNSKDMEKDQEKIAGLINELDRLKLKKQELESNGGFKLNLKETFSGVHETISKVNSKLASFAHHMFKAKTSTRDTAKSTKSFDEAAKKLTKSLTKVTKMLKLMITRMALRTVIKETGNGFKSLALHCAEFDNAMSSVMNSSKKLAYSFAGMVEPLVKALAPALLYIIGLINKLINAFAQLFAALGGGGTWHKAKDFTGKWSDDIKSANKQAKELKKTVLGFDELNQLTDQNKSGGGDTSGNIEDMFEDAAIDTKIKNLAAKIKDILKKLVDPIKKAWSKVGTDVVSAWKRAFNSIKKLLGDIGRDFLKVWNQPKTIAMLENILRIFRDIGSIIALLAENLDKAWNKNKTGLKLLEAIRDIFAIVIQHVKNMTSATVLWAKELDFTPLLEAFKNWVISMEPVVDAIAGAFEDFYRKVLLPLGKWSLEKGLPDLIDVFKRFNEEVEWDTIRERLNRVWEALEPFAEVVGEGLVKFISGVSDKIAGFLNSEGWDDFIDTLVKWTNEIDADDVARGLEKIFEALAAYKTVSVLTTIVDKVMQLSDVAKTGIVVGIKFAIIFSAGQWVVDKALQFWQWCYRIALENAGYEKIQVDIEMAWFTKFRDEYGGAGGIGHFLMDWITGNTEKKSAQWEVEAKVETLGISEAEVEVEDLRKKTEELGNSNGLQMFVEKANGSVEQLKNLDTVNFDPLKKSVDDAGKAVGDLAISIEKDTDSIKKNVADLKFTPSSDESSKIKDIGKTFDDLKISVEKDTSAIKKSAENISFTPLSDSAEEMGKSVTLSFGGVDDAVSNTSKTVDEDFALIEKSVSDGTQDIIKCTDQIKGAFTKEQWTFNGVADGLGETFRRAKEAVKREWNEIANTLNGSHDVGGGKMKINLPKFYAAGGFPEDGWFRASHGEMLGKFDNGQNVVANNQQITDGIAKAVYSAMISANNGGGGNVPVYATFQVDGETIARAVTKGQKSLERRYSPTMA